MKKLAKEEQWQRLYDYLVSDIGCEAAENFISALKDLYSLYTPDMTEWYARLYDPKTGGYYYSNSARDNETVEYKGEIYPLLPDLESTNQALNFMKSTGMISDFKKDIPDVMQKEVLSFVIGCQDEDGYFYNPQWGKEFTNTRPSRRSRDLNWSCSILEEKFGGVPNYDTPLGLKGKSPIKTEAEAQGGEVSRKAANEKFENKESFTAYLESLDITNRSYHVGNELVAASPEILARDKELAKENCPYRLMDILIDWLNEHQHPESGHWHTSSGYYGTNGLLKISGVYNYAGLPLPNVQAAAQSAIDAITSDEPMEAVVDLYNTWFTVGNIVENLRKLGDNEKSLADSIVRDLRMKAPGAIRRSKEKISAFKKPDGSFSYGPKYTSSTSQGMPVAFLDCYEGDINATGIASSGLTFYMMRALDLSDLKPDMFGEDEFVNYLKIIEENRKNNA